MDQKTSLLVQNQVPEFVREDYPKFISFVKAYYEFLETEKFTSGTSEQNNLTEILKRLRYVGDVDKSLDLFEEQFYNTFVPLLPKDTTVDKDFLIKNVLPLYQSKGSKQSFQYLFRLLFGEEIEIEYPREQILRASDGKWIVENILRTTTTIYSLYTADGTNKTFYLPYALSSNRVEIFVNGILKSENTDYIYKKELKKFEFNVAPTNGSVIKIVYTGNFDLTIFANRQLVGQSSGTTTIIEKVGRRNIGGLNLLQFFINSKNLTSNFINGEIVKTDVIVDGRTLNFYMECFSDIESLNIVSPGSGYSVGEQLTFTGPSTTPPIAIISDVSSGNLENLRVRVGQFGAGYKVGNNVYANNVNTSGFLSFIGTVDETGFSSPNTVYYTTDAVVDYLSVPINSSNYGFANTPVSNTTTKISNAFTNVSVNRLGPALTVVVSQSNINPNTLPTFEANSSIVTGSLTVRDLGAIGTIKVDAPGSGYSIGDKVVFSNEYYFSGQSANAYVSGVSTVTGGVTNIRVVDGGFGYSLEYPPKLTITSVSGTGASISVKNLMGQGAQFDYDLSDGIPGKILAVELLNRGTGITSNTIIDLKQSGDGLAVITAQTRPSLISLPGRWITSDSILSSDETKLQGENYYIDFSYVIASKVEFSKYKNIVKNLLNPSGAINYARFTIDQDITANLSIDVETRFNRQFVNVSTVNVVTGQANVWGTNTYFSLAESLGFLSPGSFIVVNSELRVVNSIINNTYLTVSENFTYNANDVFVTTMTDYDTILDEIWNEFKIEGNTKLYITTEGVE